MRLATFVAALALVPAALSAQELANPNSSGPTIGAANQNITATTTTNAAIGNDAKADQEIGAINSGDIKALNQNITATTTTNAAIGNESEAKQKIGTIGK